MRVYIERENVHGPSNACPNQGTHHHRTWKNMMEMMSKRNYIIGAREPIGGDRSPRR